MSGIKDKSGVYLHKKGWKHSKKTKLKIGLANSISLKGKKLSEKTKIKISKALKGKKYKPMSEIGKRNISEARKGKPRAGNPKNWKHTEETKRKMRESAKDKHKGEKNGLWKGGISFEPYGIEFNEDLKEVIRNRDRRKCQICGKTELEEGKKLSIHHIDYDKKNNDPKNLLCLCSSCHMKTNQNRNYWIKILSWK